MLSEKAIKEFKEAYQKEYGKQLSEDKAVEIATKLLFLMRVIYRPISEKTTPSMRSHKNG